MAYSLLQLEPSQISYNTEGSEADGRIRRRVESHLMRTLLILLALVLPGCSPPVPTPLPSPEMTDTAPASPAPSPVENSPVAGTSPQEEALSPAEERVPADKIPRGGDTAARASSIVWPDRLELKPDDSIEYATWIGGVAGTDSTEVSLSGDGKFRSRSGRSGGPGGQNVDRSRTLTPEQTKAVFLKLKDSKLLDFDETAASTVGATLTVTLGGQKDSVTVLGRGGEVQEVLNAGGAKSE